MKKPTRSLVLGAGIVGRAAGWDLSRRGHQVTIADSRATAAQDAAAAFASAPLTLDVANLSAVRQAMSEHDAVVAAVPYAYGTDLAACAVDTGCHYFDFGGNPTIVKQQLLLDAVAQIHDVAIVPDCGLAPGLANVLAAGLIENTRAPVVDDVQIRVGCLPQQPHGALEYQLAFYPGGLINEYSEPCEIISQGMATTVEPLTRLEQLEWQGFAPLEAFATAGGTSTMCQDYEGIVHELEYKTIRYRGHGHAFRAMREIGLFQAEQRPVNGVHIAPRALLEDLLAEYLPHDEPDVVLLRVSAVAHGRTRTVYMEDRHDGLFSALARTTAFPATALCDLVTRGEAKFRGATAMHNVVTADLLMQELSGVGVRLTEAGPNHRSG